MPTRTKKTGALAAGVVPPEAITVRGDCLHVDGAVLAAFLSDDTRKTTLRSQSTQAVVEITRPVAAWNLWLSGARNNHEYPAAARANVVVDGLELRDINLSSVDFTKISIANTYLQDVDLSGAVLDGTIFEDGCRLDNVNFTNALLKQTRFVGDHFTLCDFTRVFLGAALFERCSLRGTQFRTFAVVPQVRPGGAGAGAVAPLGVNFKSCDLDAVGFNNVRLLHVLLDECEFSELRVRNCTLENTIFRKPDFARVHEHESSNSIFANSRILSSRFEDVRGKEHVTFDKVQATDSYGISHVSEQALLHNDLSRVTF